MAAMQQRGRYLPAFLTADTCHFQKLLEENTVPTEFDFNWNSVPAAIGNVYLYFVFTFYRSLLFNNPLCPDTKFQPVPSPT